MPIIDGESRPLKSTKVLFRCPSVEIAIALIDPGELSATQKAIQKRVSGELAEELLLQLLFDCCDHVLRIRGYLWLEALNHVAVAVHKKLGEVPLDLAGNAGCGVLG